MGRAAPPHREAEHNYDLIEAKAVLCNMGQFKRLSAPGRAFAERNHSQVIRLIPGNRTQDLGP
jgi:hypothetical protein